MTTLSNFAIVSAMNVAFNNKPGNPYLFAKMPFASPSQVPQDAEAKMPGLTHLLMVADGAWQKLERQCKNILAEYNELMEAIAARDLDKVRDALGDIHVFAYGAHHFLSLDADRDMQAIVAALYTRFCRDEEHLAMTKLHYTEKGIAFYTEGEFPTVCLKSAFDQMMPEYPKGKFLKAVGYKQPEFYQLPPVNLYSLIEDYKDPAPSMTAVEATTPALDITAVLARERKKVVEVQRVRQQRINAQVEAYRAQLEAEAFGLPPYDPKKGI